MNKKSQTELFAPRFKGKAAEIIDLSEKEHEAIALRISDEQALLVMWDVDESGARRFRIRMLGFDSNGRPIFKQFRQNEKATAFMGEIAIMGPGSSELWSSMGYEDPDDIDAEGNITNKPREIVIIPVQDY